MKQNHIKKENGAFRYDTGDGQAVVEFEQHGDTYIITHTEVPPSQQGEGVASAMVEQVLTHIRDEGGKVKPLCAYVKRYIERHEEWSELTVRS